MTKPADGRRRRRREHTSYFRTRRFRLTVLLTVLGALLLVNGIVIYLQSPRRQKFHYYQDGLFAFGRGEYDTASIHFRRFLEMEPDSAEAHYMLGLCHLQAGDTGAGLREFRAAVARDRGFDLAHLALARRYFQAGDLRSAAAAAHAAIATDPVPAAAWNILAEVRLKLGDAEGAIDAFRRALTLAADGIESILKLGDLYRARRFMGSGDVREELAQVQYARALSLSQARLVDEPGKVKFRVFLSKAFAGLGRFAEAISEMETVAADRPDQPEHRRLLARFQSADGQADAAAATLAAAWKETPSPGVALDRVRIMAPVPGNREATIDFLNAAITEFPDSPGLRIRLVDRLRAAERPEDAFAALAEAQARLPKDASLVEAGGDLLVLSGRKEEAVETFRAAVSLAPRRLSIRRKLIDLLLPRALASMAAGEPRSPEREELDEHLGFFLDPEEGVNPGDLGARGALARLRFAEGKFEEATALLSGPAGATTRSWIGLRILGVSSLRQGDYPGAADALCDALSHPDCPGSKADHELAWIAASRAGRHVREADVAERAVLRWPDDVEWRLRRAQSLLRTGEPDLALAEALRARGTLSKQRDVRGHLLMARIYRLQGRIPAARRALEDAVVLRRDAETRGALFGFLAATGDEELARKGFAALVEESPDDPDAFLRFGRFLESEGDVDGARAQYEKAAAVDPKSIPARQALTELRMATARTDEDAIKAARDGLRDIRQIDPEDLTVAYFEGKLHLLRGEADKAIPLLARFVAADPGNPAGAYYLAIAYRRSGDMEKAQRYLLLALGLDGNLVEAKLSLATLFFAKGVRAHAGGDMEDARDAFRRVVEFDPNEPTTRWFLADSLAQLGQLDLAEEEAVQVLRRKPDDPGALFLTSLSRARRRDWDAAATGFRRLAEVAPENFRSHLYLGLVEAERGEFAAARTHLREARQRNPLSQQVLQAMAGVEVVAGTPEEAVRLVEGELAGRPDDPFLHHLLGDLFRVAERSDDAVAAYRRAFELNPDDIAPLGLAAAVLADRGEKDRAIDLLRAGETRTGFPVGLMTLRGRLLFDIGSRDAAEALFLEALDLDPKAAGAARELGLLYLDTDRRAAGERFLRKGLAANPADPTGWFRLGFSAAGAGEWKEAEEAYRRVLGLVPDDPATLNNLALVLVEIPSRQDDAVVAAARASKSRPQDARFADTLGWILHRAGRHEEAARVLAATAPRLPTVASAWYHAGVACAADFRWDDARTFLTKALELSEDDDPPPSWREEARTALARIR